MCSIYRKSFSTKSTEFTKKIVNLFLNELQDIISINDFFCFIQLFRMQIVSFSDFAFNYATSFNNSFV